MLASYANAQSLVNILNNASFEDDMQTTGSGDNVDATLSGWTIEGRSNIVNPGPTYNGGPLVAQEGNQYLDIVDGEGSISQNFTITEDSELNFSAHFSLRSNNDSTSTVGVFNLDGTVVATFDVLNLGVQGLQVWNFGSATIGSIEAGTYIFRALVDDNANVDNLFLSVTSNIPEPSSTAFLGLGALALLARRKR